MMNNDSKDMIRKGCGRTGRYLRAVQNYGSDAAFVANLILTQHNKPATKLHNMLHLLQSGYEFRTAQFSVDVLLVNGHRVEWSKLDHLDDVLDTVNSKFKTYDLGSTAVVERTPESKATF